MAVSLAYYASFYAAKSIIAYARERDPKTHSGVSRRFGQLAVTGSDFPPRWLGTCPALPHNGARPITTWVTGNIGGKTTQRPGWKRPSRSSTRFATGSVAIT